MTDLDYIRQHTPTTEQLALLAEECCELAQAALKMRRTIDPDGSPTAVSYTEAHALFHEETADVMLCLEVFGEYTKGDVGGMGSVADIMRRKLKRWVKRGESFF